MEAGAQHYDIRAVISSLLVALQRREWQQRLPNATLVAMHPSWAEAGWSAPVRFTHPPKDDEPMKNFRQACCAGVRGRCLSGVGHECGALSVVSLEPKLAGWTRRRSCQPTCSTFTFLSCGWKAGSGASLWTCTVTQPTGSSCHGMPWCLLTTVLEYWCQTLQVRSGPALFVLAARGDDRLTSAAIHLNAGAEPRAPAPLVVALALSATPGPDAEQRLWHQAQALIRHAEYHLDQLKMQRMLVYAHSVRCVLCRALFKSAASS